MKTKRCGAVERDFLHRLNETRAVKLMRLGLARSSTNAAGHAPPACRWLSSAAEPTLPVAAKSGKTLRVVPSGDVV